VCAGAVAGSRCGARVQAATDADPPLHHSALLALQGRLGLAHPPPCHLHGRFHTLRRRLFAQRGGD